MMYRRTSIPGIWREMQRFQDDMNRLFDSSQTGSYYHTDAVPAMNIYTTADEAYIKAEVPGVDIKELEISVVGNNLTISGNREAEAMDEKATYLRQERSCGYFSRGIELPFPVEADKVEASLENGIIKITLPRTEADKPRRIIVKTSQEV
jgi:HSP20 family protein